MNWMPMALPGRSGAGVASARPEPALRLDLLHGGGQAVAGTLEQPAQVGIIGSESNEVLQPAQPFPCPVGSGIQNSQKIVMSATGIETVPGLSVSG